jgi:hypothetical protein
VVIRNHKKKQKVGQARSHSWFGAFCVLANAKIDAKNESEDDEAAGDDEGDDNLLLSDGLLQLVCLEKLNQPTMSYRRKREEDLAKLHDSFLHMSISVCCIRLWKLDREE